MPYNWLPKIKLLLWLYIILTYIYTEPYNLWEECKDNFSEIIMHQMERELQAYALCRCINGWNL